MARKQTSYSGMLAIGDPHIEGRQPGFRSDDYPRTILNKLQWCFDYAKENNLLPLVLGDVFDKPRDNATWLINELIEMMLTVEVVGIFGNHDCADTTLNENDTLSILISAGCLRLVSEQEPWTGTMSGRPVLVGGSSYRAAVPQNVQLPQPAKQAESLFKDESQPEPLVVWLTHHDIALKGYDAGQFKPFEIENCDLLINGHIHRQLDPVQRGQTLWLNPGNISRRSRSDAARKHTPTVLHIGVSANRYTMDRIEVPHRAAHDVFHEMVLETSEGEEIQPVQFVDGLKELQVRRTDTGAGLHQFLEMNLTQFDENVAEEIRNLARMVTATEEY